MVLRPKDEMGYGGAAFAGSGVVFRVVAVATCEGVCCRDREYAKVCSRSETAGRVPESYQSFELRKWPCKCISISVYDGELMEKKNHTPPNSRYTLLDGFFVVMGGFVVDVDDADLLEDLRRAEGRSDYSPLEPQRMTLTTTAVENLARDGLFLKVPRRTIKDKSKADVLAKGLVCCQVLWMVVQVCIK
jgi:hypothetical protein